MNGASRFISICLWAGLAVAVGGCTTTAPGGGRIAADNHASRVAQIIRVAGATRRGGDLRSAAILYGRAHDMAPEQAAPLAALGEIAGVLGQYPEASRAYAKAVELDPENAGMRRAYAMVLIAAGHPRRAAEQLKAALTLDDADHRSHNGLGIALDLLGEHQTAQGHYRNGIAIAPSRRALRNNLALSLAIGGNYVEALRILQGIAAGPAADARSRQNLALVHGLAGNDEKAAEIGRIDLSRADVENNLAYYRALRKLSPPERAAAVLGLRVKRTPGPVARSNAKRLPLLADLPQTPYNFPSTKGYWA